MTKQEFQQLFSSTIPQVPGVYRYYDARKKLLYVGKAKNLKKRVTSYFIKDYGNGKTRALVHQIANMEWTVTNNEHDAFLLENSLIKHFKPPYNISLKDDKSYPYIVIKNEHFPRVFLTRRFIKDGSEYLGPYTAVHQVRSLMELIKHSVPLRTCKLDLTPANIKKGKFKKCLEYHLGNCKAPCEALQTEEDYMDSVQQVRQILKGHIGQVLSELKQKMQAASANLEFEKAQQTKDLHDLLQGFQSRSSVVHPKLGNVDVASLIDLPEQAYVNYLVVVDGSIVQSKSIVVEKKMDESAEDMLSFAVSYLRPRFHSNAMEIIVPFPIHLEETGVQQTVPLAGDKKKLLDLSFKNADEFIRHSELKQILQVGEKTDEQQRVLLEQVQQDLKLKELPEQIECFDNSNFQGSYPVAAMVCFKNGLPFKKEYRHFHIKTVEGINDFASMAEIVYRRYKRVLAEEKPLPQLVIIDGGKGQLSAAVESLERLDLMGKLTVVGLAKREESLFYPGDSEPLQLPFNGPTMLLIRKIRDEVHRFGITFHRDTRSKGTIKNELEDIAGIGEKTATDLLQRFRSVSKIKQLTLRELTEAIGQSKARLVFEHFRQGE